MQLVVPTLLLAALSLFELVSPASAQANGLVNPNFIQHRPYDAVKMRTGLPVAATRLITKSELQVAFAHSNVFMGGENASENLILDGESSQLHLRYRRQFNKCFQVNAALSLQAHTQGHFDKPLDDWHQFFGLPDAMRDEWPNNELEYRYRRGNEIYSLTTPDHGLGDAHVQLQHGLGCKSDSAIVRFGLKLPVGKQQPFFSNGAVDAFVDFQSRWYQPGTNRSVRKSKWGLAYTAGVLLQGDSRYLPEPNTIVGFGSFAAIYAAKPNLQLLAQLDWHSPIFDSELVELGKTALQLTLGTRFETSRQSAWEFSFAEDAVIDTGPDIVVRVAYTTRFGK